MAELNLYLFTLLSYFSISTNTYNISFNTNIQALKKHCSILNKKKLNIPLFFEVIMDTGEISYDLFFIKLLLKIT